MEPLEECWDSCNGKKQAYDLGRSIACTMDKTVKEEKLRKYTLDYEVIEEEFSNRGKEVPLTEEERIGLTLQEREEINPCGTYCGTCAEYFEYPDPGMSDEIKQWWFDLRMKNFNKLRPAQPIEIEDKFEKNVRKYMK